jgi:hypothetical protein
MMTGAQKLWPAKSLIDYTRQEIASQVQQLGKALPVTVSAVSGAFVTVNFQVSGPVALPSIQVPQAISRYARPPTQVGDKGFVISADTFLGGVTGLGGGVPDFNQQPPNLSALVYIPLSNTAWPSVDTNAYHITAPNGAVIQDDTGANNITLTSSAITVTSGNSITLSAGGHSIVINSTGVIIDGRAFLTHHHSGVTIGSGNTGNVV